MAHSHKPRILLGKLGLDCHDTGITTLAYLLREHGFEVVYVGLHNSTEGLYQTAVQEGAEVIGVSFLSGQHLTHIRRLMALISKEDNIRVLVGGVIRKSDIEELMQLGVERVYGPGTMHWEVVRCIEDGPAGQPRAREGRDENG